MNKSTVLTRISYRWRRIHKRKLSALTFIIR